MYIAAENLVLDIVLAVQSQPAARILPSETTAELSSKIFLPISPSSIQQFRY